MKKEKQRMVPVTHTNGRTMTIPICHSFYLQPCNCDQYEGRGCGMVNIILEDANGRPFAAAQFTWRQILEGFTEVAIKARDLTGEQTH